MKIGEQYARKRLSLCGQTIKNKRMFLCFRAAPASRSPTDVTREIRLRVKREEVEALRSMADKVSVSCV